MADEVPARGRTLTQSEAGFSLAEVLVTIVIVGIAFTAILGGMITMITVSDLHRKQATADTIARDAAEWIKDDVKNPYKNCATKTGANAYQPASSNMNIPNDFNPPVVEGVEYWNGASSSLGAPYSVSFPPRPCVSGLDDYGLQRITIEVSSTDGRVNEMVQILKRRVGG